MTITVLTPNQPKVNGDSAYYHCNVIFRKMDHYLSFMELSVIPLITRVHVNNGYWLYMVL